MTVRFAAALACVLLLASWPGAAAAAPEAASPAPTVAAPQAGPAIPTEAEEEKPAAPEPPAFGDPCGTIEEAARTHGLPIAFFTRLLWQESGFRPHVVSPKGAQGIAQFMPGTAADRGLVDPFEPVQAIFASAELLRDLRRTFGNVGLAAAAYNAGPTRVSNWLAGTGSLPYETQAYVRAITGRSAADWSEEDRTTLDLRYLGTEPAEDSCPKVKMALARRSPMAQEGVERPTSPWGVSLAGSFSRTAALNLFANVKLRYGSVLAGFEPMVLSRRNRSRGTRAFHQVRIGAATRQSANQLCAKLRAIGGACAVLRN
jgi:hypothetical protein